MKCFHAVDAKGEAGTKHIVEDGFDIDAWAEANAADLLALGFTKVIGPLPYTPTRAFGDRRKR